MERTRLVVHGIVQGVGFRPFVFRLARRHGLGGTVSNTPEGVVIEIEGEPAGLQRFAAELEASPPPLAMIDRIERQAMGGGPPPLGDFRILASATEGARTALPPPDLDVCPDCLAELFDPADRRHRYPFITCTDCGPRYTLIRDLPFDRPHTAMASFPLCQQCGAEYHDPADRRFHAQTIACPACGPSLRLCDRRGTPLADGDRAVAATIERLRAGAIVAIKGVGGFHLAVDATDGQAVARLRYRKHRPHKPLAVMVGDLATASRLAAVSEAEAGWLAGPRKPIVLLKKSSPSPLADLVAPGLGLIGVMLPYTPLHHLLFHDGGFTALVMTSGNRSGEPIVTDNRRALTVLGAIADAFLMHDRDIVTATDDSVLRVAAGRPLFIRRARSFAPVPLDLGTDIGSTLALGAADKSTICLSRGRWAFLSQHLGDLDNLDTIRHFETVIAHLEELLAIAPDLLVHDLHPDYPSSRYARDQKQLPTIGVQHHHAHAVSCMAEHGLTDPTLAVTLDGSGYGTDGTIWGGEILLARPDRFERLARLTPVPMPGGEAAVREPWRMAASHLRAACGPDRLAAGLALLDVGEERQASVLELIDRGINSPLTSSCGRLFDAVAALLGLCTVCTYDGQAAAALEQLADPGETAAYPTALEPDKSCRWRLATAPIVAAVIDDIAAGVAAPRISGRFHNTLAGLFAEACCRLRDDTGINRVVLSGGCLQNALLAGRLARALEKNRFRVFTHLRVPPNDGGLALGQAVIGRAIREGN